MSPMFTIFLFAMSLLAIAAACALLIYIYNELQRGRKTIEKDSGLKREEKESELNPGEAQEVEGLLAKMKSATLIGASQKSPETEQDKN